MLLPFLKNVAVFTHRQHDKDRKAKGSTDTGSQSEGGLRSDVLSRCLNKEMEHRVKSRRGTKDVEPKTTGSDLCVLQTQGLQETAAQSQWVTKYIKSNPD